MSGAGGRSHSGGGAPPEAQQQGHGPAPLEEAAEHAREEEAEFVKREESAHSYGEMKPALGTAGAPGRWERGTEGAGVALHIGHWEDGRWSYLYKDDTRYAPATPSGPAGPSDAMSGPSPAAPAPAPSPPAAQDPLSLRGKRDAEGAPVVGPMIHAPVWTWEVPLYFWFGGMSAGASFVALACDLAGDEKSARIARRVALAAVMPAPPLLIADLGRPARFLNMLRIFKPRSPMSMGAWALMAFSSALAGAVGADLLGRRREARAINAGAAVVGGYFGSYTGILLAATAVPLWARSRLFLGPIFVCTGAATGAAACRLVLIASGLPEGHPTRRALGRVETGAMSAELALSVINERRLGELARDLEAGAPGKQFKAAKWLVRTGLALRFVRNRTGRPAHDLASVLYLLAGLLFRFAWVGAGRLSAKDDETVAKMHKCRTA